MTLASIKTKNLQNINFKTLLSVSQIDEVFHRFYLLNKNPKVELNFTNAYTLLVAIILSARTTDISVNKATKALFTKIQNPEDMISLGEEKLKVFIKTIGLYNNKANNIIKMSNILIEKFNSIVPRNMDDLISLPGVGRKSASVLLSSFFKKDAIAVDTHVFRVSNRIGLCSTKSPKETEIKLFQVIPQKWIKNAHHWLVLHGRYICKARKPDCDNCSIKEICIYQQKKVTGL